MSSAPDTLDRPGEINARPVRHPGRWIAIAVLAVLAAMLISSFVTNAKWDWPFVWQVMKYKPVITGLLAGTILGTIGAMIIGVVLGVLLAIMRLTDNPVLKGASWLYIWFFRGIPRYVLLIVMSVGILYLYDTLTIGLPFLPVTFFTINVKTFSTGLFVGILALGLSEAAYMAEIARAGILSVDKGQDEAACALGMSKGLSMRRVILPQAMRVIVPPTGNETLSMVKDTSLLVAVPVTNEMFFQAQAVSQATYKVMPSLIAAVIWYLIVSTILGMGQSWLERHFGRGFGAQTSVQNDTRVKFLGLRGGGGN
ncbi:amino acid ABC transporter permease [Calidifontibacter sp. DB0510]|uniref:Amino acid ABC transporter permease n=1 Tax=Metallococcus carri TaxID=1656884 RepID=A0A967E9I3_9MICO|nr:amino acid ABC transporter permease [Metallococcus carri]NHN56417.1 amino acid ABC transporter permease [Metallococcus carri]NOP36041.1 amino acid ABC transporter permease [Calidifontibacter sp. DB2511S]